MRLPAGQTENRERSEAENAGIRVFWMAATRNADSQNPAPRGDFGQEKGPGEYPGPGDWWSWGELNPRPQIFLVQFYMFSDLF